MQLSKNTGYDKKKITIVVAIVVTILVGLMIMLAILFAPESEVPDGVDGEGRSVPNRIVLEEVFSNSVATRVMSNVYQYLNRDSKSLIDFIIADNVSSIENDSNSYQFSIDVKDGRKYRISLKANSEVGNEYIVTIIESLTETQGKIAVYIDYRRGIIEEYVLSQVSDWASNVLGIDKDRLDIINIEEIPEDETSEFD